MLIVNNCQLKQFYQECQKDKYIGIDTEFYWTETYKPELCLIQLANSSKIRLIDPLKYNLNLKYIEKLLLDKKIKKILHSSSQDLRIFYDLFNILPVNIFDTQIGVLPLGYDNSTGLSEVCQDFLKIKLNKEKDFFDWRKRPLSASQIKYAKDDVKYLKLLYDQIKKRLIIKKRTSWIITPHKKILNKDNYINKEKNVWKKVRFIPKTKREFFLVKKISYLREKLARKENIPPKKIISNSYLIKLCKTKEFSDSKTLSKIVNDEFKNQLHKLKPQNIGDDSINKLDELTIKKIKSLKLIVEKRAQKLDVHPSLIANKSEITEMVLKKKIEHFCGWKKKLLTQTVKDLIFK